jgi:hypothetical protein
MSEWNRAPGRTAADVNLDAAPLGFKVTGDAAWDSSSVDYAMFSAPGNRLVADMVTEARRLLADFGVSELTVSAWIDRTKQEIEAAGHGEVWDTMVRETIAYSLDEAWFAAFGHRFDETGKDQQNGEQK